VQHLEATHIEVSHNFVILFKAATFFSQEGEMKYDPFVKLHEYIHPFILQYMSGRDLLTMTEVSSLWKEIVEKEGKLEKKVRLNVNFDKAGDKDRAAIHESRRKYEVIDVAYAKKDKNACVQLIQKFAASVTDLSMDETIYNGIKKQALKLPTVDFPNLKRLKLSDDDADWLTNLTFQLEELTTKSVSSEFLNKLLKGQKKLKVLDTTCYSFTLNFVPEFALEVFHSGVSVEDFTKFLYTQRQTLKEVKLKNMEDAVGFIQLLNEFPQLTKLCIGEATIILSDQQAASISINPMITHLTVLYEIWPQNIFEMILLKFPNLRHLKVSHLNLQLLRLIVQNMPQLKKLVHVVSEDRKERFNALEKYEQLKRKNQDFNRDIVIELEEEIDDDMEDDEEDGLEYEFINYNALEMLGLYGAGRRQ